MYQKILDEALQELKETDYKDLFPAEEERKFVNDCQIDSDMEMRIPEWPSITSKYARHTVKITFAFWQKLFLPVHPFVE